MPPQGRFNTGEKMNGLIMIVSWIVFAVTGLLMWFHNVLNLSLGLFQWMILLHDLTFIVSVCMFFIHFSLAMIHPPMKAGQTAYVLATCRKSMSSSITSSTMRS